MSSLLKTSLSTLSSFSPCLYTLVRPFSVAPPFPILPNSLDCPLVYLWERCPCVCVQGSATLLQSDSPGIKVLTTYATPVVAPGLTSASADVIRVDLFLRIGGWIPLTTAQPIRLWCVILTGYIISRQIPCGRLSCSCCCDVWLAVGQVGSGLDPIWPDPWWVKQERTRPDPSSTWPARVRSNLTHHCKSTYLT
jgi:hypothetical protein